jgi:hypothetical protein
MDENPGHRPRWSLTGAMKLVVFCAVGSACVAPTVRLWEAGVAQWSAVVAFEAVALPLVLCGVAFAILRRGPARDRLMAGLLFVSVSVALGLATWLFFAYRIPTFLDPQISPVSRSGWGDVALHAAVILALLAALVFLASRLVFPGRRRPRAAE